MIKRGYGAASRGLWRRLSLVLRSCRPLESSNGWHNKCSHAPKHIWAQFKGNIRDTGCNIMIKRVFTIFILTLLLLFSSPVYSLDTSSKTLEKYTKKISNKFTRTYCNTTKFGISYDGALAFAIGETNKEFKNNKLNKLIDYSLLKNSIVNDLENNCQVYDFAITSLENLKFN